MNILEQIVFEKSKTLKEFNPIILKKSKLLLQQPGANQIYG